MLRRQVSAALTARIAEDLQRESAVAVAASLNGGSRLQFGWHTSDCESVRVFNGSQYRPRSL